MPLRFCGALARTVRRRRRDEQPTDGARLSRELVTAERDKSLHGLRRLEHRLDVLERVREQSRIAIQNWVREFAKEGPVTDLGDDQINRERNRLAKEVRERERWVEIVCLYMCVSMCMSLRAVLFFWAPRDPRTALLRALPYSHATRASAGRLISEQVHLKVRS